MKLSNIVMALALAIVFTGSFAQEAKAQALTGDIAKGKKLFKKKNCKQCHKKDGMGKAKIVDGKEKLSAVKGPKIAGLSEAYVVEKLKAIKMGAKGRKTRYMKSRIKSLKDQDMADIAAFVKSLGPDYKGMLEK